MQEGAQKQQGEPQADCYAARMVHEIAQNLRLHYATCVTQTA